MTSFKNMVGFKTGRLEVVEFSHNGNHRSYWKVKCECGGYAIRSTGELNRKRSPVQSCGCYMPKRSISGIKYGSLTALKISHKRGTKYYWTCKCDCGNEKNISEESLTRGRTLSCGCLRARKHIELLGRAKERLVSRCIISESGCWEWQGGRDSDGYGTCGLGYGSQRSHRASYKAFKGEIPQGMFVCHHCDNPPCINPDHLFIGTNSDNILDGIRKGSIIPQPDKRKGSPGVKNCKAKLDEEKVKYIRFLCENGYRKSEIAKFFGVWKSSIENIARRKTWSHI